MKRVPPAVRFALVGAIATGVHMATGIVLIGAGTAPLLANPLAFCVAFAVSFFGHYSFSFAGHGTPLPKSLFRFVFVALAGLLINQAVLALLIGSNVLNAGVALVLSTLTAAVATFVFSRSWAFGQSDR